jgi:two-component system response regulator CpxR
MTQEIANAGAKILIVDDDKKLCRLLADYLGPMGYDLSFAHTGPDGLEQALTGQYQAIVLDVMLPGMDGLEVLRNLRQQCEVPVLMLTARGDETDRIVGLEMGADDYLPKPFSTRELLARLRAILRRFEKASKPTETIASENIVVGAVTLSPGSRTVTFEGAPIALTSIEFDLLYSLMRRAGRVLTRDQILDDVSGREYDVFDRSIDVHISALRRKLGDDPKDPRYIRTVRGAGYLFMRLNEEAPS